MSEFSIPTIDPKLRPDPRAYDFDLTNALNSIVALQSRAPNNAYTAAALGTERTGHGVVINEDGMVLTIGYLILEAETIWLVDFAGNAVTGHVAGYDNETGFGLVQPLGKLSAPPLPLGSASSISVGDLAVFSGFGGQRSAITTRIEEKREFAGYWEYLIEGAIFTSPAHPFWGGGALIGNDGTLCGIGSLYIQENRSDGRTYDGNMIVPSDLLIPIFNDLQKFGSPQRPSRPWLGALTAESDGKIVVVGLWDNGPADKAGLKVGDIILDVNKALVSTLSQFFRSIWSLGNAGVKVPLNILRAGQLKSIIIGSGDRSKYYRSPRLH